jgi:hypothetical protein
MPYTPPLIRPPLPPLRPPSFRPPLNPPRPTFPPVQTDPTFEFPTLPKPVDTDLVGEVCIYSNNPIYTAKKIRYRYPGESWQEIVGDRYTLEQTPPQWNSLPMVQYRIYYQGVKISDGQRVTNVPANVVTGGFVLVPTPFFGAWIRIPGTYRDTVYLVTSTGFKVFDQNGTRDIGHLYSYRGVAEWPTGHNYTYNFQPEDLVSGSFSITKVVRLSDNQEIPPVTQCIFKVFNLANDLIFSATKDVCPEVEVIPESCIYKPEKERLVKKVVVGQFQSLRVDYQLNCATVWLDSPPFPFSLQMYKECSEPPCPPPKIRLDKKCLELCQQCPPGTVTRVLTGSNIDCVDINGCIIKTIKYKFGCNNYDCVCN